jgi:hypothetical protein
MKWFDGRNRESLSRIGIRGKTHNSDLTGHCVHPYDRLRSFATIPGKSSLDPLPANYANAMQKYETDCDNGYIQVLRASRGGDNPLVCDQSLPCSAPIESRKNPLHSARRGSERNPGHPYFSL